MRGVRRPLLAVLVAAAVSLLVPPGAHGVVGPSSPDTTHPHVGVLLPTPASPVARYCGATPVSHRVLVLAGHCAALRAAMLGETRGTVTFDPDLREDLADFGPAWVYDGGYPTYTGTLAAHPAYGTQGSLSWDVAVLVLDEPLPASVEIEALPAAGLLDRLKSAGTLRDELLTLVGYGSTVRSPGNVPGGGGERRVTSQVVTALSPMWLRHHGGGDGGAVCHYDSGSPVFRGDQLVAVLSQGDAACSTMAASARLDVPPVRDWLLAQVAAAG